MSQEIKICSDASGCLIGGLSAADTIQSCKLVVACGHKIIGGTSSQFLKADGSTDAASYTTCLGDITGVTAGGGLSGGGTSGSVTVAVDGGLVATLNQSGCPGLDCVGTTTASNSQTFTNKSGNISQWTNDSGYTTCNGDITAITLTGGISGASLTSGNACIGIDGTLVTTLNQSSCPGINCTGTTTASNSQTFTNKSGNISQWTNDSGYTTCTGDITQVTAGDALSGGAASGNATLGVDAAAAANWDQSGCAGINCTGTTTASNSQTFTNKSGNISQWTNDSGYTTCTGDILGITLTAGLTGASLTSGTACIGLDGATAAGLNQSACPGINCVGDVTGIDAGTSITVGDGTTATPSVGITTACNTEFKGAYTTAKALSSCAGLACVGDITAITLTGGLTGASLTTGNACVGIDSTAVVYTAGNQTIAGNKCFTGNILSAGVDLDQLFGTGGSSFDTAGAGLSSSGTTVGLDATTANSLNQASCPGINCTGTTTASNSQTFTNKAGNISQWTNDSGYTTCTGDITQVTASDGLSGGATSGNATVGLDAATANSLNQASCPGINCTGTFDGTGLANFIPVFNDADTLGCSSLCMNGSTALYSRATTTYVNVLSTQAICPTDTLGSVQIGSNPGTVTGVCNIGIGAGVFCGATTSGSQNVGIGDRALRDISSGGCNVAIGWLAATSVNQAQNVIAIGEQTLFNGTSTADHNIALGQCAMYGNSTFSGDNNIAIGRSTLRDITTGTNNIAIGEIAGINMESGSSNIAVGLNSMFANTTGNTNIAIGTSTLLCNTDGDLNTAVGSNALRNNVTGCYNTAFGSCAQCSTTTGCFNNAVGYNSLCTNSTGQFNNAFGNSALLANNGTGNSAFGGSTLRCNTTGDYNTGVGYEALYSNTTGCDNVAIGHEAMYGNTTGTNNVGIGNQALFYALSGDHNFALGQFALYDNYGGDFNTAVGTAALQCNTTGSSNAALGYRALLNNTTGNDNFGVGECALESNVNGIGNNAQGHYALGGLVTGNYTIGLGQNAGAYHADGCTALSGADDSIYIGRDTRGKDDTDYNSIVIGLSACSCGQNTIKMGNGDITAACVQVAWTAVSDERDKTDIADLNTGLTFIGDLKPKAFKYRENRESTVGVGACRYGFIAQDILQLEGGNNVIVSDSNPDQLGINSDYLIPVLVKAIQELEARVKQLESPESTQS